MRASGSLSRLKQMAARSRKGATLTIGGWNGPASGNVPRMSDACAATVRAMDHGSEPEILPLAEPRPLTADERGLLDFLLAGPVDSPELRAQAATATVVGTCSCGCPSIQLGVDQGAPGASLQGPEVRNAGWAEIRAVGSVGDGVKIGVALHVVGNLSRGEAVIRELEIWPTPRSAVQNRILPPLSSLQFAD